jgi:hypothetical protein
MANPTITVDEKEIKQLRKYVRQSKAAIPGHLVFGVVVLVPLLVADWFVDVHWLVYALLLWVVPYGLIGDGVNIVRIKRKLERVEQNANATRIASPPTSRTD